MTTKITYIETLMQPLEMWVEGRTARDYISQGFEIVDYEPPPEWLIGCCSGKAKIRKKEEPYIHKWSPELVALHKAVCNAWDKNSPPWKNRITRDKYYKAHSMFFGIGTEDLDYHTAVQEMKTDCCLEDIQKRITRLVDKMVEKFQGKTIIKYLNSVKKDMENWKYIPRVAQLEEAHGSSHGSSP